MPETNYARAFQNIFVAAFVVMSTFFLKGVLSGFDCTQDPMTGQRFLDVQPDIECSEGNVLYNDIQTLSFYGLAGWTIAFGIICTLFLAKGGKERFDFLTGKMEDKWYWWELWLLLRKVRLGDVLR